MPAIGLTPGGLSYCAQQVRRFDHDRYLTALFAAAHVREDLLALYAFNLEIARTRELVREPMMGRLRLQWWRDCIGEIYAGGQRRHQVAQPLAAVIRRRRLTRTHFDTLLDAREADMDDAAPADMRALTDYAAATSATLGLLALEALGDVASGDAAESVRCIWTAWALIGLLRAVPFHAASRRLYLPQNLMAAQGLAIGDLFERKAPAAVAAVVRSIAAEARGHLEEGRTLARRLPRRALPVLMQATLAQTHLRRLASTGYDVFAAPVQEAPRARLWRLLLVQFRGRV